MDGFTACQRVLPCRCSINRRGFLGFETAPTFGYTGAVYRPPVVAYGFSREVCVA